MHTGLRDAACFWLLRICNKKRGTGALPETLFTHVAIIALPHTWVAEQRPTWRQALTPWPSSIPPSVAMMACCSGSISLCSFAGCTASAADKILDCSLANGMSRARLFGGTLHAVCTGAGRTISTARLSATHGLASYNVIPSFSIATLACSSTATPDKKKRSMHLAYRSVQRYAYVRHYCLVQVDSCPVRCLRRETHLGNPDAQTSEARGKLCPFPRQLGDFTSQEHRHRLSQPSFQASLQRGHHHRWDQPEIIIQGMRDLLISIHAFAKLT